MINFMNQQVYSLLHYQNDNHVVIKYCLPNFCLRTTSLVLFKTSFQSETAILYHIDSDIKYLVVIAIEQ